MWIKGGRVIDPATKKDAVADIEIEGGIIKDIRQSAKAAKKSECIDATGKWIIPGLIDMHVHFREPGFEYKEDILSGSMAAAAGGITTAVCMANTRPVNDNPSVTGHIMKKVSDAGIIRVLPVGAATKNMEGRELSEMGLMKKAGIVAVSDDGNPIESAAMMRRAMQYASTFGLILMSHCQDRTLSGKGVMNEGRLSSRLGLPGIPNIAEDVMVARDIMISAELGIPVHITHVSTHGSISAVRDAKKSGVPVTCDVTPHNLLLTEERVRTYDTNAKMYPPLRSEADRQALIDCLKNGTVDCIATDHAPHAKDEKDLDFDLAPFGVTGLQTLLPAILKLHYDCRIPLMNILAMVTINPARILGIEGGRIDKGGRADIAIVDPKAEWTLTEDMLVSKSKNSPFIGWKFKGRVTTTIAAGKVVYKA
ncbi:MAG TPA: dihydroorotase [Desulfomonilia bacterium]